jgi:DNA-binding beta-propeller fold protein YncE
MPMRSSRVVAVWLGSLLLAASLTALAGDGSGSAEPSYRTAKTVFLGGPEDWDYVYFDASSRRAFVAHGTEITVVDGESGRIVGRVPGLSGAHGVATVPELGRGYAVSRNTHTVVVFDLKSLQVVKSIPVSQNADSMAADPVGRRVLVTDGEAPIATIIDPARNAVVATVQLGGTAEQAVADRKGGIFINLAGKRQIVRLETRAAKIESRWSIPSCEAPHGISMDYAARRLFVSCLNALLLVVDADNGHVVASLPIGHGTDGAVYDSKRKRVFSSNGWDGTLSVINQQGPDQYASGEELATVRFARTMDIDPATGRIYLAAADLERMDPHAAKWAQYVMKPGSVRLILLDPVH